MNYRIAMAIGLVLTSPLMAKERPPLEYVGEPSINGQRLPFADAVRVDNILYLSGALGLGADGKLPEGIEAQARLAMDHIGDVLKGQGLGFGDIIKCTVMLDNMADWPAFNAVYIGYFPDGKFPARSAFGADGLALGALVELECIAYAGPR